MARHGYEVVHGRLEGGQNVTLSRRRDSAPDYFRQLIASDDAVMVRSFDTEQQQDSWILTRYRPISQQTRLNPTTSSSSFPTPTVPRVARRG